MTKRHGPIGWNLIFSNRYLLIGLAAAFTFLAVACGSNGDSVSTAPTTPDTEPTSATQTGDSEIGDPENGRKLFTGQSCSACHRTGGGRLVGPGLAGISSRGDDAYIRQSMREPGAIVVDGFPNVMSDFSRLSEQDVNDLIAYLRTLN